MLMRLIDEQYTRTPFYGVPKMTATLRRSGYTVNPKRVRRLMRKMELHAIFPQPKTSTPGEAERNYPYLLQAMVIDGVNQVWSTDITYVRMARGCIAAARSLYDRAHANETELLWWQQSS